MSNTTFNVGPSLLLLMVVLITRSTSLNLANCRSALGMQSGEIPDAAITASSSFDQAMFGPSNARIRTEGDGGAWCPRDQILKNGDEYLEIDLGLLKVITLVETQGRFGNGQGQEYVDQYRLQYQREESGRWFTFHNRRGQQIFQGNANTYMSELREVDPPLITRRLRFVPYSVHPKHACLRVELYGCAWKDGLVSYDIPQGDRRGVDTDFTDVTYDGLVDGHRLTGGLGQLTDGDFGSHNFRIVDARGTGIKGYDWVGWNNDSSSLVHQIAVGSFRTTSPAVEMIFRFDVVRNFTSVRLHCNNMQTRDVRVFRSAQPAVSRDGINFASLERYVTPSLGERQSGGRSDMTSSESVRNVTVALHGAIGRYMLLRLEFSARWMLVSEVEFISVPVTTDFAPPDDSGNAPPLNELTPIISIKDVFGSVRYDPTRLKDEYLGVLIGSLATFVVLMLCIAIILLCACRRRRLNSFRHRLRKCFDSAVPSNGASSFAQQPRHCTTQVVAMPNGKVVKGARYQFVGTTDTDVSPSLQVSCCVGGSNNSNRCFPTSSTPVSLPELPLTPPDSTSETFAPTDFTSVSKHFPSPDDILSSDSSRSAMVSPWVSQRSSGRDRPTSRQFATLQGTRGHRKTPGAARERSLHGGNSLANLLDNSAVTTSKSSEWFDAQLPRVAPEIVQFVTKLDEGRFGEIFLCEVRDASPPMTPNPPNRLAVVKTLRPNADEKLRRGFQRMIRHTSRLTDGEHVTRCLGVSQGVENAFDWAMFQYTACGDLKTFLRQHQLAANDVTGDVRPTSSTLSHATLVYMASQVSSAMKHLESLNVVHGNLAARTCLVDDIYQVKVSDIGDMEAGCLRYPEDYSSKEFSPAPSMPIRWMAWESVFKREFSSKSDVWSFGVTFWEILTLCRLHRPLDDLLPSDADVLTNLDVCWRGSSEFHQPAPPFGCPREIYDLMRECWQRDPASRPSFRDVDMFLQRKNVGYHPTKAHEC